MKVKLCHLLSGVLLGLAGCCPCHRAIDDTVNHAVEFMATRARAAERDAQGGLAPQPATTTDSPVEP
jgi:hypothetical protein